MVNFYSSLAADRVCFNSTYNRDSFFTGLDDLLAKLPDRVPSRLVQKVKDKSQVLPVPLPDLQGRDAVSVEKERSLVWNHRWEYDKGLERFLAVLEALPEIKNFKVHVLGQKFQREPECMSDIRSLLERRDWLGTWGPIAERAEYLDVLARSKLVLSTALHDFQGLSVLEGFALRCFPVVPNRLAYKEFVPEAYRYFSDDDASEDGKQQEARSAAKLIQSLLNEPVLPPKYLDLSWNTLKPDYMRCLNQCAELHRSSL
jgi:glycosyltransferase involved in cell wall biosynthesis